MVRPIPDGYHSVTPYLILSSASDAIAFYKKALGADEVMRMDDPAGKIHHAEISIGGSRIMLADEHPEIQALSPKTIGGSPVSMHVYVEDVDTLVERAVAAGAKLIRPVADQFYGDRVGASRTHLAIAGSSRRTKRICRWTRFAGAPQRRRDSASIAAIAGLHRI